MVLESKASADCLSQTNLFNETTNYIYFSSDNHFDKQLNSCELVLPASDELLPSDWLFGAGGEREEFNGVIPRFAQLPPIEPTTNVKHYSRKIIFFKEKVM